MRIALFLLLTFMPAFGFCQSENKKDSTQKAETIGDKILRSGNDSIRQLYNGFLINDFRTTLKNEDSFEYAFEKLDNVSKVYSPDHKLRFYTWIMPTDSGNHFRYFGFIQYKPSKKKPMQLFEMQELMVDSVLPLKQTLNYKQWFGALYYSIIEKKNKGIVNYVLIGWRGKTKQLTQKVIDVLSFKNDQPYFGQMIFQNEKLTLQSRLIFEYNADAVMSLRYDDKLNMIVMDHLSPADGFISNDHSQYGPDFSYDALKFEKGIWKYHKEIDLRNGADNPTSKPEKKPKEFYNPEK
jgi:hypothetical protein